MENISGGVSSRATPSRVFNLVTENREKKSSEKVDRAEMKMQGLEFVGLPPLVG